MEYWMEDHDLKISLYNKLIKCRQFTNIDAKIIVDYFWYLLALCVLIALFIVISSYVEDDVLNLVVSGHGGWKYFLSFFFSP